MNESNICNKSEFYYNLYKGYFADTSTVTRKLDLDQTSMAHIHTEIHKYDKSHFSVRHHDFLHSSPITYALYVVIMFVFVCLCRFIWQNILLTSMSYELVAHFDLSLELFLGDF